MCISEGVIIAFIGFGGVVVGAVLSIAGQFALNWRQERGQRMVDKARKELLRKMLERPEWTWRSFSRLKDVVGADDETTKRLLLEIGARGSEDGEPQWGLISRNPFMNER